MKPHDVGELIGLSTSAIRTWSMGEFKQYLSPSAQGGEGRHRDFTDTDTQIINHINELKKRSVPLEEIHASLKQLQADDWIDLPPLPEVPSDVTTVPVMPREVAQTAIQSERRSNMREIATLEERIEKLEKQLELERTGREALLKSEREGREEKLVTLLREMSQLETKLAAAETELRLYREGRIKPQE
jgi:DNA-binding transcriptional MerR regulator